MVNRASAESPTARVDSVVNGKYVLDRRLGGGGMAEVFLARTVGVEGFSRQVAIKRVLSGLSNSPEFARLFVSEAQLTSRLQHPNIVSVLDFDRDLVGRLFLVMELVEGTDLQALLETGALPFPVVIHVTTEILRGLDFAHDLPVDGGTVRGIIHRDMSPHNVLVSWNGAVKVADFGIAKARAASNASASMTVRGKPAYMSPEQAKGEPLDGRSDLFSVGVMLYELLCLQPLFAADSTATTIARLLNAKIPTPREVRPEVPDDLSRAVMSLLARDREKRAPNAAAAIAALVACTDHPRDGRAALVTTMSQRFIGRAPVRARGSVPGPEHPWGDAPRRMVALPPGAHTITPLSALRFTAHRRRWPWLVLAIFVAATTIVGAILVTGHGPRSESATPAGTDASRSAASASPALTPSAGPAATATPSTKAAAAAAPSPTPGLEPAAPAMDRVPLPASATPPATPVKASGSAKGQVRSSPSRTPMRPKPSTDGIQEIRLGGT